jgi:type IV pilus assembly protein PilQ
MLETTSSKNRIAHSLIQRFYVVLITLFSYSAASNELTGLEYNTVQKNQIEMVFSFAQTIAKPTVNTTISPATIELIFAADNFDDQLLMTTVAHAGVKTVRLSKQPEKVIATIQLTKLLSFDVQQQSNQVLLVLSQQAPAISAAMLDSKSPSYINSIASIDFKRTPDNDAQLLVYLDEQSVAIDASDKLGKLVVEFHNTELVDDLLYTLDVSDFGTLVNNIETFRVADNARLVIDINGKFTFKHQQLNNVFSLVISKKPGDSSYLSQQGDFSGKAISLNFQDIPVRTVLQIIADYNNFNLVISDAVVGNITLALDGVPWDQALEIILKVKDLDKRMEGNILMIAPSEELAAQESRQLQSKQQVAELAGLYSEYVQVNYAKAAELAALLKNDENSILSSRGGVSVDERTNTLLIRDTAKSIEDIKRMVSVLDVPVRQVVIESRMVTVKDNINEELGIRWGITDSNTDFSTSGTLNGASSAAAGIIPALVDQLNVNLPVATPAGSIAFQVARLADGTILDLELSAMENENKGEIIASPRITTANQKEAYIEQGVEIPYQEAASSGATSTQFKKAVLSLTVTPHITPDDRIILDLVVTQDTVSSVQNGSAPAIDTQRIGTQVLVNNGETIVLGGIYQQSIISTISKVPVLGDIPYFGWMFRNSNNFNEKKELLIFVTPRIVTEGF